MGIECRKSSRPMSSIQQDAISKCIDMSEKYNRVIEFENENIATMQEQIALMRQKVFLQRKTMGGVNASKENVYMIQKQIRILENRLDKALLKYNEAIATNKNLRESIDDLRRERVVFESIYKKMERQLQERKQQMSSIIELSNQSYEQRDAYQMEIAAIEQANRKEEDEFSQQCAELSRMLESELKLPSSMTHHHTTTGSSKLHPHASASATSPKRTDAEILLSSLRSPQSNRPSSPSHATSDRALQQKQVSQQPPAQDVSTTRVQNFEEAFNKIKNATGITDIDELVKSFIKNEDHNFSLFNYVSEQNSEIERAEEAIQALKAEERRFSQESGMDVDSHKLLLKELEVKLESKESAAEKYEDKCKAQMKIIESLKRGIHSIYYKFELLMGTLGSNDEDAVLGDTASGGVARPRDSFVTESNMVHYLGEIEQKTNKLLVDYANVRTRIAMVGTRKAVTSLLNSGAAKTSATEQANAEMSSPAKAGVSMLGTGPKIPMGKDAVTVNPPKLDEFQTEEEEEEEDDSRPFTREELKNKTLSLLQKRGNGGGTTLSAKSKLTGGGAGLSKKGSLPLRASTVR